MSEEIKKLIMESGYFDEEWYLERYPDVRDMNMSPLEHFMKYGWKMIRNPSNKFNTQSYLQNHPNVASMNPLVHYLNNRQLKVIESSLALTQTTQQPTSATPGLTTSYPQTNQITPQGKLSLEERLKKQLETTQTLLEKYFILCQEFEAQILILKKP